MVKVTGTVILLCLITVGVAINVQFGDNLPKNLPTRVKLLFSQVQHSETISFSCGNTTFRQQLIADSEIQALSEEGFIVRTIQKDSEWVVVSDGKSRGAAYGCYEALQQLGFGFLHPLKPLIPTNVTCAMCSNSTQQPYWPIRSWHIHTEHPLELTDFLQGFDVKVNGTVTEPWITMMDGWLAFLDWAVGNKINKVRNQWCQRVSL